MKASLVFCSVVAVMVSSAVSSSAFTAPRPILRATSRSTSSGVKHQQPQKQQQQQQQWTQLFAGSNGEVNGAASPKKVLVLGGDGFCGWPTSLYLSDQGHQVIVVDNLSRRNIDIELGCDSLTPIQSPEVSSFHHLT